MQVHRTLVPRVAGGTAGVGRWPREVVRRVAVHSTRDVSAFPSTGDPVAGDQTNTYL